MRTLISREFLTRGKSSAAKSRGCSLRVAVFPPISPKADMIGSLQINLGLHRSYILNGQWINVFFIRKASEYFKDLVSWKCELLLERGEELNNSVLLVKLNVIQLLNNTGEEFSFFRFVK